LAKVEAVLPSRRRALAQHCLRRGCGRWLLAGRM